MSIESIEAFHNEASVAVGDDLLHLVIDFRVIDLLEGLLQRSMDELIVEVLVPKPPHALTAKFVWAMTRARHPDLKLEQVAAILYNPKHKDAVAATAGGLLQRAFNIGGGKEEGEQSRPPRKRSSGASRGSARSGSRRGSNRTSSGEKRPARS